MGAPPNGLSFSEARTSDGERTSHPSKLREEGTHPALAHRAQDWLKKPLSISLAFSSAETSTLRGVSRNIFSAIRCMPPSRA